MFRKRIKMNIVENRWHDLENIFHCIPLITIEFNCIRMSDPNSTKFRLHHVNIVPCEFNLSHIQPLVNPTSVSNQTSPHKYYITKSLNMKQNCWVASTFYTAKIQNHKWNFFNLPFPNVQSSWIIEIISINFPIPLLWNVNFKHH